MTVTSKSGVTAGVSLSKIRNGLRPARNSLIGMVRSSLYLGCSRKLLSKRDAANRRCSLRSNGSEPRLAPRQEHVASLATQIQAPDCDTSRTRLDRLAWRPSHGSAPQP